MRPWLMLAGQALSRWVLAIALRPGTGTALLLVDVENMEAINHRHGSGDEAVRAMAEPQTVARAELSIR